MYGLWGYLSKAKALALINVRRVLEVDDALKVKLTFISCKVILCIDVFIHKREKTNNYFGLSLWSLLCIAQL